MTTCGNNMEGILLDAALLQARETVEAVKETGLSSGFKKETHKTGDTTWEVTTYFWADTEQISVQMSHQHGDPEMVTLPNGMMAQMISGGETEFKLPLAWLPKGVEVGPS